jgi:hypothetical protein
MKNKEKIKDLLIKGLLVLIVATLFFHIYFAHRQGKMIEERLERIETKWKI